MSARDLQTYGLIPEFLGRLPIISVLHPLSTADLVRILTEPKNALVKQYQAIFESYGCELRFTRKALDAIAEEGAKRGGGARGLRGIMEEVLGEGMFEIPGSVSGLPSTSVGSMLMCVVCTVLLGDGSHRQGQGACGVFLERAEVHVHQYGGGRGSGPGAGATTGAGGE